MLFQKVISDGYLKKIDRKKKERKRSLKKSVLQFPPMNGEDQTLSEKVSFCAFWGGCEKQVLQLKQHWYFLFSFLAW